MPHRTELHTDNPGSIHRFKKYFPNKNGESAIKRRLTR
uniref:Uncharacterized protein n=1 Tax=Arundo donax TaxID=35708 RepID=A0A0A9ASI4_ARUDO